MSDEQALLAAILANPDEDTPRLAYADWLDEHADALAGRDPREVHDRAAFIRLQIEAACLPEGDKRLSALEKQFAALQGPHDALWREPFLRAYGANPPPALRFRRGFLDQLEGSTDIAVRFPDVAAVCPIQELTFKMHHSFYPPDFGPIAACPALARVRRIDVEFLTPEQKQTLFASPHLTGPRFLRLRHCRPEDVELVSALRAAATLQEFWLRGGGGQVVPGAGLGVLVSAGWPALESARIDHCDAQDAGVLLLASEFAASGRRALHVSSMRMTRDGVRAAAEAVLSSGLHSLSLAYSDSWREEPHVAPREVRELRIQGFWQDGDYLVGWLTQTVPPGRFDRLGLIRGRISHAGARVLAAWPGLAHLKELDLSNNWIGDGGAKGLAASPHLDGLEALCVAHNDITKTGKDALKARFGRRVRIS